VSVRSRGGFRSVSGLCYLGFFPAQLASAWQLSGRVVLRRFAGRSPSFLHTPLKPKFIARDSFSGHGITGLGRGLIRVRFGGAVLLEVTILARALAIPGNPHPSFLPSHLELAYRFSRGDRVTSDSAQYVMIGTEKIGKWVTARKTS
jgi:hypothetical protein